MNKRLIQLALGLAISAALLFALVGKIDTGAVSAAVGGADARLIVLAIGLYFLAMGVRAVLWRRILAARASTATLFQVSIVGFAVSYVMPLRVGEIARAYLLARWCGVEYGTTLASMIAERVLDGLSVSALILVALLFVPAPGYVVVFGLAMAGIFLTLSTVLIAASARADLVVLLASALARRLPASIAVKVERLAGGFARGLHPLRNFRALPGLVALSLTGWLCQFAVFYLIMLAFRLPASVPLALLTGGVANFATLLPSAPGFVGTFDAAVIKLLMDMQRVSLDNATAYALVVHTVLVVPIVILGALVLWRADLSLGHIMRTSVSSRRSVSPAAGVAATSAAAINTVLPI